MIIISDASTLILLEKIGLLSLILKKEGVVIPPEVYKEAVVKGKEENYPDSIEIDKKVKNKLIKVLNIKDKKRFNEIKLNFNLADGETEAIVLYHEKKGDLVALDDLRAMRYCDYYNIPFATAINFVADYFNKKMIKKQTAQKMIRDLGIFGRYKDEIIFFALNQIGGKNG